MSLIERIKTLCEVEELTREKLAEKTGIRYVRLSNMLNNRGQARIEEIEAIGKAFPEYKMWLAYGEELPEAGQISPLTKSTLKNYKKAGGD